MLEQYQVIWVTTYRHEVIALDNYELSTPEQKLAYYKKHAKALKEMECNTLHTTKDGITIKRIH